MVKVCPVHCTRASWFHTIERLFRSDRLTVVPASLRLRCHAHSGPRRVVEKRLHRYVVGPSFFQKADLKRSEGSAVAVGALPVAGRACERRSEVSKLSSGTGHRSPSAVSVLHPTYRCVAALQHRHPRRATMAEPVVGGRWPVLMIGRAVLEQRIAAPRCLPTSTNL